MKVETKEGRQAVSVMKTVLLEIENGFDELGSVGSRDEMRKLCELAQHADMKAQVVDQIVTRLRQGNELANDLARRLTSPDAGPREKELPSTLEPIVAAEAALRGPQPNIAESVMATQSIQDDPQSPPPATPIQGSDASTPDRAVSEPIALNQIGISRWNRAYDSAQDETYLAGLKKSIETDGLMHPITLVLDQADESKPYKVPAGAGRLAALTMIRGKDGTLGPDEYRLLSDITEGDAESCTRISVSENRDRRESSVIETARYVQRLSESKDITKQKLGDLLHIPRTTIGKLIDLAQHFDQLPESWQEDYSAVPGCESTHTPAITRSHWDKISATVKRDKGVTPRLKAAMEKAHDEELSVAKFDIPKQPKPEKKDSKNPEPTPPGAPGPQATDKAAAAPVSLPDPVDPKSGNMYSMSVQQWSPWVGCEFACEYCKKSFQAVEKRQKGRCQQCYDYKPHEHPKRLAQPLKKTGFCEFIFTCDKGDVSSCSDEYVQRIVDRMKKEPDKTFLLQSKNPATFGRAQWPRNVVLGTTIETNRDDLCSAISKAPPPSQRMKDFLEIVHPFKQITIEPVMKFDLEIMVNWIAQTKPRLVWLGYDSKDCGLPAPSLDEVQELHWRLGLLHIPVVLKSIPAEKN